MTVAWVAWVWGLLALVLSAALAFRIDHLSDRLEKIETLLDLASEPPDGEK